MNRRRFVTGAMGAGVLTLGTTAWPTASTAATEEQVVALGALAGADAVEPFPVALDLETASDALESYLG